MDLPLFQHNALAKIDHQLQKLMSQSDALPYSPLFFAARYSLLSSGKRLRPLLVLAVCESYGIDLAHALVPACALEMIHTYSLIHDDLPCMDDDDVRRGQPSLHKVYPEWHALLTGDFLLTYPFEILTDAPHLDAEQKLSLIRSLSSHAGAHGMIGGQMIDLLSEGESIDWSRLEQMHLGKTAGLITAALEFGGIISHASPEELASLQKAGSAIGIAFQIIDDILDVTDDEIRSDKATAVSLLGIEAAEAKAHLLLQTAKESLKTLSHPQPLLTRLFDRMIIRKN
ncbi:MAG: polyprenyl synthetase family protein [Rhabdochlamydiaceae bacterium]